MAKVRIPLMEGRPPLAKNGRVAPLLNVLRFGRGSTPRSPVEADSRWTGTLLDVLHRSCASQKEGFESTGEWVPKLFHKFIGNSAQSLL
jgi:hypothetical protein